VSTASRTLSLFVLCVAALAAAGCASGPRRPHAAIEDDEIRVLLPATLTETYETVWAGLDSEGWQPLERRRDPFYAAISGEDARGRRLHARMKRHAEDETLLGIRIASDPAVDERELRQLLPTLLLNLEAYEPAESDDDPFDYIHPDRFRQRFRTRFQ